MDDTSDAKCALNQEIEGVGRKIDVYFSSLIDYIATSSYTNPRHDHLINLTDSRYLANRLLVHETENLLNFIS